MSMHANEHKRGWRAKTAGFFGVGELIAIGVAVGTVALAGAAFIVSAVGVQGENNRTMERLVDIENEGNQEPISDQEIRNLREGFRNQLALGTAFADVAGTPLPSGENRRCLRPGKFRSHGRCVP